MTTDDLRDLIYVVLCANQESTGATANALVRALTEAGIIPKPAITTDLTDQIEVTQADREAALQWANQGHLQMLLSEAFARHRQTSVPVQTEPVAWRYVHPLYAPYLTTARKPDHINWLGWTETPLYTYAQTERERALLEALRQSERAIAEYYRYWTGGETRGSYDGKPERKGLWDAQHKARQAIAIAIATGDKP